MYPGSIEDLKTEIHCLQEEMALAIDNDDFTEAHRLEREIDELQKQLFRIKSSEHEAN